jgi:hypothetical protein
VEPWVIRWKDREWKSADQSTLMHIAVANEYGREDQWQARSPWNGQEALAAWLTVLLAADVGDVDIARLLVHATPPDEFYACLTAPEPTPAPVPVEVDDEVQAVAV